MSTRKEWSRWLPILMYHRVVEKISDPDPYGNCINAAVFDRQMRWFSDHGYRCLRLSDVAEIMDQEDPARRLPRRAFVITFDDGYADTYHCAWPILRHYGCAATVFLVTDTVGGTNDFDRSLGFGKVQMLSESQVLAMQAGGFEFGSHSCSHPADLTKLTDRELEHEVVDSKRYIESLLDTRCNGFCYPHGKLDAQVEAAVERAGYSLACGAVGTRMSTFCLGRSDAARWTARTLRLGLVSRGLKYRISHGTFGLGRMPSFLRTGLLHPRVGA